MPKNARGWMKAALLSAVAVLVVVALLAAGRSLNRSSADASSTRYVTVMATLTVTVTTGRSTSGPMADSGKPVKVGTTIGFAMTDTITGRATVHSAKRVAPENPDLTHLRNSKKYLLLDVSVECTGPAECPRNPAYWMVSDADGRQYDALSEAVLAQLSPGFGSGEIRSGQKVRGLVAIDAPDAVTTISLTDPIGGVVATWSLR